jgi:hypothetical protein
LSAIKTELSFVSDVGIRVLVLMILLEKNSSFYQVFMVSILWKENLMVLQYTLPRSRKKNIDGRSSYLEKHAWVCQIVKSIRRETRLSVKWLLASTDFVEST